MSEQMRNMMMGMVLSMGVFLLWEYYYMAPQRQQAKEAAQLEQLSASGDQAAPAVKAQQGLPRLEALGQSERISIDTPSLDGSIALTGARIDDLKLKAYHETLEDKEEITLLSPSRAMNAYYTVFGWSAISGPAGVMPDHKTPWKQARNAPLTPSSPVTLEWANDAGLEFTRTISVDEKYMFTIADQVKNTGAAEVSLAPYGIVARHGQPDTAGFYILHEGAIGYVGEKLKELKYKKFNKFNLDLNEAAKVEKLSSEQGGWIGFTDKYWMTTLIAETGPFNGVFKRAGDEEAPIFQTDIRMGAQTLLPGNTVTHQLRMFAGAKEADAIKAYEQAGIPKFYEAIDWGWFSFLTKPFFWLLHNLYKLVGNFGVAIILLTIVIKLVMFPLAYKSYVSMSKMKKLQPEMEKLKERYAGDNQGMQKALMELYKKEKANPAAGCLPLLLQIPVFFALYKVLFVTIEMRHQPFFGWIKDLSAPDPTSIFTFFGMMDWDPPRFLMIGIWPLIMGVTMWVTQQLNPQPTDPIQKKIFAWMPVMFTFMLGSFPAGLVIYWTINNLFTIVQQSWIMKSQGVKIELWDNVKRTFGKGARPEP